MHAQTYTLHSCHSLKNNTKSDVDDLYIFVVKAINYLTVTGLIFVGVTVLQLYEMLIPLTLSAMVGIGAGGYCCGLNEKRTIIG